MAKKKVTKEEESKVIEKVSTRPKSRLVLVSEKNYQLNISERKIVICLNNSKKVVVENLGFGDVYVGSESVELTGNFLVRHGEEKVFKDVESLVMLATSRPTVRVKQFA